jgi:DNA-binding transcriptional ArsR family regulator
MTPSNRLDIINALNHEIRRKILLLLEHGPMSYTKLLESFDIATGKLNYHLKLLDGLVEKNSDGLYKLTSLGEKALGIMMELLKESGASESINLQDGSGAEKNLEKFDEKALRLLEYIRERLDEEGYTGYRGLLSVTTRKRVIIIISVTIIAVSLLFTIFTLNEPQSSPGAPGQGIFWSLFAIIPSVIIMVILVLFITVYKLRALKGKKSK